MRTIIVVRRYRCVTELKESAGEESSRRTSLMGETRSTDRRSSFSRDRRNSYSRDRKPKPVLKEIIYEDGFMQICGYSTEREMQAIQESLYPLEQLPYKLECTCPHCISYSYEDTSTRRQFIEPFMRAINVVFSTICKYDYILQSTISVQNADDSSTTTWVWVKTRPLDQDNESQQSNNKNKKDDKKKSK